MNTRRRFLKNLIGGLFATPAVANISFKERPKEIKIEHLNTNTIPVKKEYYAISGYCDFVPYSNFSIKI